MNSFAGNNQTAAKLLANAANESRSYESRSIYLSKLEQCVSAYKNAYLEKDWSNVLKITRRLRGKKPYKIRVRHLIRFEKADATIIEHAFGVSLPESVHRFYNEVTECVLTLRNLVVILTPEEVVKLETKYREIERSVGLKEEPVRLIRFALNATTGECFAFRKRVSDDKWAIGLTWDEQQTAYFQSAELDSIGDPDIDTWMERLLSTDGHPIIKQEDPSKEALVWRPGEKTIPEDRA
jgi:hypothetical protein